VPTNTGFIFLLQYLAISIATKIFFILSLSFANALSAQRCDTAFFATSFFTNDGKYLIAGELVPAPQNELLWLGLSETTGGKRKGIITKLTTKGSLLWSREYTIANYANLEFFKIIPLLNGSALVAGRVFSPDPATQTIGASGIVILSIDKFGNVLWSKVLDADASPERKTYFFGNLIQTRDDGLILSISVAYSGTGRKFRLGSYILRLQANGEVVWAKQMVSDDVEIAYFGSYYYKALKQLPNGNIVTGSLFDNFDVQTIQLSKMGYYFAELDYATGNRIWDKSYLFKPGLITTPTEVKNIALLPNGDLSFVTHVYGKLASNTKHFRPVNIITNSTGNVKNIISYYNKNTNADSRIADVYEEEGNQVILMEDDIDKSAILAAIDTKGQLKWQKAFKGVPGTNGNFSSSLFPVGASYYFASTNKEKEELNLYNVDTAGSLTCLAAAADIVSESAMSSFEVINTNMNMNHMSTGKLYNANIRSVNINLQSRTDCRVSQCCTDIVDTAGTFSICEGSSFTLPDNTVVKEPGWYYTKTTNQNGCDRIGLYKISVIKNPSALTLPADTCMSRGDTIKLMATAGFEKYYWMNNPGSTSSDYAIYNPGVYRVSVANACGSKTDTIVIDEDCIYPVYIPTAFTPNGDNLNDVFQVPLQNRNHFLYLKIFNRYGNMVFQTANISQGWDGLVNNLPQPTGTYVYYLEMKDHRGKKIIRKGTFVLIR
jgi:gliding motility-associated-like protein